MPKQAHIAVDLGAGSGRVILGTLDGGRLSMHETHRFEHEPLPTPAGLCWDFTGLWRDILVGLRVAAQHAQAHGLNVASIGVDTWGVDFAFVTEQDELRGLPRAYRDPAFSASFAEVEKTLGSRAIYQATGIQLMALNSLYQYAQRVPNITPPLSGDDTLLFMPDLFHWLLTGRRTTERTIASTSQMVDARTGRWNHALIESLGLATAPLKSIIDPGTVIGPITPQVAEATGLLPGVRVVAPPSHDTASAVTAVPASTSGGWCFLSSGTWSLLGTELDKPCITDASFAANFTNELGVNGTVRFLKNIAGLWLVQETRRQLQREGKEISYAEMTEQAAGAEPMRTLLPVNDAAFAAPGRMIDRIRDYAKQSHQPVPQGVGQVVRCCLESLALTYRQNLGQLEALLGKKFEVMHVVGGGGKNGLLNRMTAHATGLTLKVGPHEATAIGNLLTQAMGLGLIGSLDELRRVVAESFEPQTIPGGDKRDWAAHAERFEALPAVKPQ